MAKLASIDYLDRTQNIVATSLDWPHIVYMTLLSHAINDCSAGTRRSCPHHRRTGCP